MHVLHRPHHPHRAIVAAVAAAVLAIVLTLAIAGGLNDPSPAPTPVSAAPAAVHAAAVGARSSNPFTRGLFTSPFTARVRLPWAAAAR